MWNKKIFAGFDTETTGVDYSTDKIVTAAIVFYDYSTQTIQKTQNWLADPGIEISHKATEVNGISTEYAQKYGRPLKEVLVEIRNTLIEATKSDIPIVIFNANFDLSILNANLKAEGLETIEEIIGTDTYNIIDPLVIDRAVDKYRKGKRTLESMIQTYNLENRADLHDAQVDTEVMLDVLNQICKKYPQLQSFDLNELYLWQKEAYKAWADNFNSYLARTNRPANVSDVWPVKL